MANRGEIATRIFATARTLGLGTVAVYADPDAGLPFVRDADLAVRLPGDTAAETYLAVDRLLDAAARSGAGAVHPGYGFLAESAPFARAVLDAGLTWIGPPPDVIAAMGDKVQAKRIAAAAGVPLLPSAEIAGDDPSVWRTAVDAAGVGWPLLLKAAAGGGGRGMRIVEAPDELPAAVASARREAEAAFGDRTVFAERLVRGGRHVEVQVLGDVHGRVVHLGERECSIQRRHQKLVEESPSPGITDAVRARLHAAAVALADHIRYVNAGTVELLVEGDGDDARFWFLEMNTRLQVEHRVTELVTGRDLVEDQIRIAWGEPLAPGAGVGGGDLGGEHGRDHRRAHGHAIEVRLYAEDPAHDFAPTFGTVHRFGWTSGLDASVEDGSEVGTHFDPMLAKVYSSAPTRAEAVARLADDLRRLEIHGLTTNRDLLVAVLDHPAFTSGDTTTDFLERFPEVLGAGPDEATRRVHAVAATLVRRHLRQGTSPWPWAPAGWRLGPWQPETDPDPADGAVVLHLDLGPTPDLDPAAAAGGATTDRDRDAALDADGSITFELEGLTHTLTVHAVGDTVFVNSGAGQTEWVEPPRFPEDAGQEAAGTGPVAPMPGTVVAVEVEAGDPVVAGQLLVVLEAMKMEHRIEAPGPATVEAVLVAPGDRVDAHQLLVRLT